MFAPGAVPQTLNSALHYPVDVSPSLPALQPAYRRNACRLRPKALGHNREAGQDTGDGMTQRPVELNDEQRRAVEHGGGPLLIVAGAGTGKTRVIVERIGHLLEAVPALRPENILALTYSDKAAKEMQQRAIDRFGDRFGAAVSRCRFATFHAFCNQLLQEQAERQAIDKTDHWIFLRRRLEHLDLGHYLRISEPGRFLDDLVEFCSRCHDNLVTPSEYSAYVDKLETECRELARQGIHRRECSDEEIARQQELVRVYARSEQMQEQEGLLSFGAMISRALALLDASPEFLRLLQQRHRFLLVDEFQDANLAQIELLTRLAGEEKNITVVGDDDQAIYRFRGASFASFHQFEQRFPGHARVVLNQNYRSTRTILEVAATAIAFNSQDRYQPGKRLLTSHPAGVPVEVWEFADEQAEAEFVAAEIARQVKETKKPHGSFAVLYRMHRHRDRLVAALRRRGIPFAIRGLAVNDLPPVRDLLAYLRAIGDRQDSISLLRVLAAPRWGLERSEALDLLRVARHQKVPLREVLDDPNIAGSEGRSQLAAFLARWGELAREQRLRGWLSALRQELGLFGLGDYDPALKAFSEFVAAWDREKTSTGLLADFLEYFSFFEEARGSINLPEQGEAPSDQDAAGGPQQKSLWEEPPVPAAHPPDKVQLMTVHAAKGLEFENVFVLRLLRNSFPSRRRDPLIAFPAALTKGPLPKGDFHVEEERRLFYVALTRAQETLTLSTVANKRQHLSQFVEELRDEQCPGLVWKRPVVRPALPQDRPAVSGGTPRSEPFSRILEWAANLADQPAVPSTENFSLSISEVESYLRCPLQYQFSYVWRVPAAMTPPLLFGTIMHASVRELVRALADGKRPPAAEALQAMLARRWPAGGFPDPVQERTYREMGLRQLEGLGRRLAAMPFHLLEQEKPFEFQCGGTQVRGRIDQINRLSATEAELIEYKAGRAQKQKDADQSLQLTLYARACEEVLGLQPARLALYNLETQEALLTSRSAEDFRRLERTLQQTRRNILAGGFSPQPGYHCRYCAFRVLCPAQENLTQEPDVPETVSTLGLELK